MQPVYIIGTGQTAVAEHWERTAGDLASVYLETGRQPD